LRYIPQVLTGIITFLVSTRLPDEFLYIFIDISSLNAEFPINLQQKNEEEKQLFFLILSRLRFLKVTGFYRVRDIYMKMLQKFSFIANEGISFTEVKLLTDLPPKNCIRKDFILLKMMACSVLSE
jgi:hypothetical protein